MTTAVCFFPAFDWAISSTHPEREERLLYTRDVMAEEGVFDLPQVVEMAPRLATEKEIARVHICVPDVAAQATTAHRVAAGGTLTLADARMRGDVRNAFAIIRPPGHHAMRVVHGNRGFCNVHNEAVMVAHLRQVYGVRRIAIVDTDVHHGDGTQEIFYHDPDVLVVGLHQDGRTLYPGTGFPAEIGGPGAVARNLNVPLPPGTNDAGLLYVIDTLVRPVLEDFQPELVINSAGQDNHYTDPLANMAVSAQGYAHLNERLSPDLAVLEGGYAIRSALPYVNLAILLAMAGVDYSHVREPDFDPDALRMSQKAWDAVREAVDVAGWVWQHPDAARSQVYPELAANAETYTREKDIYYDTDGITESQQETVQLCDACAGWVRIESRAHGAGIGRRRIWAITIPWGACPACALAAWEQYRAQIRHPRSPYDFAYIQDRVADVYQSYRFADGRESVVA